MLVGPSQFGKTCWARSLGKHVFQRGSWDYDAFDKTYDYIVFDDFDLDYMISKPVLAKGFFGCQGEVVVTGKYRASKRIHTSCPVIFSMNHDDYSKFEHFFKSDWGLKNICIVKIENKLF